MLKKRHKPELIVTKLRQVDDPDLARPGQLSCICQIGVGEATC